jgi:hypothetical protein
MGEVVINVRKDSLFRRVAISSVVSICLILAVGSILFVFSGRSKDAQMMRERDAVSQCYAQARKVAGASNSEKGQADDACKLMKDEYMRKWNRYKF